MASIFGKFKSGLAGVRETIAGAKSKGLLTGQGLADFKAGLKAVVGSKGLAGGKTFQITQPQNAVDIISPTNVPRNASKLSDLPPVEKDIITSESLGVVAPIVDIPEIEVAEAPVITPPPPPIAPTEPTEPTAPPTDPFAELKDFLGELEPPPSTADAFQQAQLDSDIVAKQQKAIQANAQISNIIAQGERAKLLLDKESFGKGAVRGIIDRRKTGIDRDTAIRVLPLQMLAEIANNNLAAAQSSLQTLFKLKSDDATNLNNFNNKLAELVFGVASAEQKNIIDARIRQENRDFQVLQGNIANARNVANSILSSEPELASLMSQIDWASPTAQQDFAILQGQVSKDPMLVLDRKVKEAQLLQLQRQTAMIGQPTSAQVEAAQEKLNVQVTALEEAENVVDVIDGLSDHKGLAGSVGAYGVARWTPFTVDKADRQDFIAGVSQLIDKKTLDTLIQLKKAGGTLGALSDQERIMLRNAASRIGNWEITNKKGKVTGYAISEDFFRTELNVIKVLAQKAILEATGTLLEGDENALIDNITNNKSANFSY